MPAYIVFPQLPDRPWTEGAAQGVRLPLSCPEDLTEADLFLAAKAFPPHALPPGAGTERLARVPELKPLAREGWALARFGVTWLAEETSEGLVPWAFVAIHGLRHPTGRALLYASYGTRIDPATMPATLCPPEGPYWILEGRWFGVFRHTAIGSVESQEDLAALFLSGWPPVVGHMRWGPLGHPLEATIEVTWGLDDPQRRAREVQETYRLMALTGQGLRRGRPACLTPDEKRLVLRAIVRMASRAGTPRERLSLRTAAELLDELATRPQPLRLGKQTIFLPAPLHDEALSAEANAQRKIGRLREWLEEAVGTKSWREARRRLTP